MSSNDSLPVTLLAAFDYPDAEFRSHLMQQVEVWVSSLAPRHSAPDLLALLGACKGTVLEPFHLNDDEAGIAALLGQIAFSKEFDQTRLRVVSTQTLGSKGGCVLTNNLQHFYVERFALGKRRRVAQEFWRYVPRNKPITGVAQSGNDSNQSARMSRNLSATAELTEDGYQIDVSVPSSSILKWPDSWRLAAMLAQYSNFGNPTESLSDLGISIVVTANGVHISPASPEATMRLTAQMLSNRLLVLSPGSGNEGAATVHIRLAVPEEGKRLSLNTLVSLGPGYFADWISVDIDEGPRLSTEDRLKIAEWTLPPAEWVDNELLETI